ncbi:MAG TPA: sodium:proline symporter [Flavobacteriales bacterium]|jgi:SSS family solute:Na+ symporter|nr:sodium:proline symporter [Flavobacteriales bacterium]
MALSAIDYFLLSAFIILSIFIGIRFRATKSSSLSAFFLGGRNIPWYIAGMSMVATTFSADTPLAVSELVGQNGISKNWLWWSFLIGGMLTTFFFAHYWRRSNILTEVEFIDIRYSGKPARFLRGFKAIYLGMFMNSMVIAWVNLAFATLLSVFFDLSEIQTWLIVGLAMVVAVIYSSLSGLLGIAINDAVQFIIAMIGAIALAWLVLSSPDVGGISSLQKELPSDYFHFLPSVSSDMDLAKTLTLTLGAFLAYVGVQWWASWYPGMEPGGGGYVAQRMMSVPTERDAMKSSLFFQIAHYAVRPWPWILVGLAAIYLYDPDFALKSSYHLDLLAQFRANGGSFEDFANEYGHLFNSSELKSVEYYFDYRKGYVFAMRDYLPNGVRGLVLAAFFAAYMSTISTQLNMGASFLVNDLYLPFLKKKDKNSNAIVISRIATFLILTTGLITTTMINSITGVWEFVLEAGAGLGLVLILRWYWWRVNAYAEIAAMLAPFIGYSIGQYVLNPYMGESFISEKGSFFFTVVFTTISWISVVYLTNPEPKEKLRSFIIRARPEGFWGKVYKENGITAPAGQFFYQVASWLSAIFMTYGVLFLVGKIILSEWTYAAILSAVVAISALSLGYFMSKLSYDQGE